MGYTKLEEATAPSRFLLLTLHFVMTLRVTIDLKAVAGNMHDVTSDNYTQSFNLLSGFSYSSMACFAVEYILLFMGVSLFTRSIVLLSMIAHLTGLILVALFVYHFWSISSYISFVVVFSYVPTVLELLNFLYIALWSYKGY